MRLQVAIVALVALGCGPDEAAPPAPSKSEPARAGRNSSPEIVLLRAHLDHGRLADALAILDRARLAGEEEPLLRARAEALRGKSIEAIRLVETARARNPADPAVWATAAEIYAAADKLDAGWDEVKKGEAVCGGGPELTRAKGILWISREGGAEKGLTLLEEARRLDPGIPFIERPLSQAHLLCGKKAAAARRMSLALEHARSAVAYDPDEVDARRFLSETLAAAGDFDGSIAELELLVQRGEKLGSELALTRKKAGIEALLARDRPRALAHFLAARKLGLTDAELSTGARLLEEEAEDRIERGIDEYERGGLAAAEKLFREAIDLDADLIAARNHLALVLFKKGDFAGAAEHWRAVLETARAEKIALPEPVHLNLARALLQTGDADGARRTLEDYLRREPSGEWAEKTRALLSEVPPAGNPR